MSQVGDEHLLCAMLLIRIFERELLRRNDHGFQLFSSGQEAVSVGLCAALGPADQLLSSGRSIGPALARGLAPPLVMAELLGRSAGPNRGKGGRGHLALPAAGFFGAHAVVAGNLSIAAGVALSMHRQGLSTVAACIFGDGACGAGALHETLNLAALWKLPLVFVCDNNQYSVSTPASQALAPARLSDLAGPFGIRGVTVDGMDVRAVRDAALPLIEAARSGHGPAFIECISYRFASHSTASREIRSAEELARANEHCPIRRLAAQLQAEGVLTPGAYEQIERETETTVRDAIAFAESAPYPDATEVLGDVA
ncbi:MAG: thiamine pyrophosphate-dependent dehydrogenase E1 component subunit alpha [Xanthobacteraceae bacterium]